MILRHLLDPSTEAARRLGLYYRTVKATRWSQLWWRARYRVRRHRPLSPAVLRRWTWRQQTAPRIYPDCPAVPSPPLPADGVEDMAALRQGSFRHLNQTRWVGRELPDWRLGPVSTDRLWTINLHYHAWAYRLARLAAAPGPQSTEAADLMRHYVSDWMSRCAPDVPGARDLAWNAFAVATRLSWWVRSYYALGPKWWQGREAFSKAFVASLWQQAAYLHEHLEWDLLANHLLRDATGLAWAGCFFDEPEARKWLGDAARLAVDQADEQVLADGGHFERSPAYHSQIMGDLLTLALLLDDPMARERMRLAWGRAADYLAWLRHPDGQLALFNDGGLDRSDDPGRVLKGGERLGFSPDVGPRVGGRHFPVTGMVVWHGQPWTVFFDVGPVGPHYQPGHAHADTLSVECSFLGQRLFVDPGSYGYDRDERRRYDRSTRAHNTVEVDGVDSSEVWHIFRVGRRACPRDVKVDFSESALWAEASHDGYDHLRGRPRHTRRVLIQPGGTLAITDCVDGAGKHVLRGGFLLDPRWSATPSGSGWTIRSGSAAVRVTLQGPDPLHRFLTPCPYHPEYGLELPTTRLCWELHARLPVRVSTVIENVGGGTLPPAGPA